MPQLMYAIKFQYDMIQFAIFYLLSPAGAYHASYGRHQRLAIWLTMFHGPDNCGASEAYNLQK